MPTLAQRLSDAARALASVSETPRLDAEILLAHALEIPRAHLLARLRETAEVPGFDAFVERRLAYEPMAYILGVWEFFSLEFAVRPPVLVPRPETEGLVETALEHIERFHAAATQGLSSRVREQGLSLSCCGGPTNPDPALPIRVLDLGTGSGCIAIAIARNVPHCEVTATDVSAAALELARENAARLGAAITFRQGDLFAALDRDCPRESASRDCPCSAPFDVIVSNPPYVEEEDWPRLSPVIRVHEDPRALLAGPDGLAFLSRIIAEAPRYLRPGGLLALEMGEKHWPAVRALLLERGFSDITCRNDLAGIPRIACALRSSP